MCSFHIPVMQREVVESLRCGRGGIYVDGTVGGGDMPTRFFATVHQTAY